MLQGDMAVLAWTEMLLELKHFSGKIYTQIPNFPDRMNHHDLIIIDSPTSELLLRLASNSPSQVAIVSSNAMPEELRPFYDWHFDKFYSFDLLSKDHYADKNMDSVGQKRSSKMRPALFLDRDGVINIDHGYVSDPNKVELIPGVGELISNLHHHGHSTVVVTNQSGIGRGYYQESDFNKVMKKIEELLVPYSAKIDHIEFASYHPMGSSPELRWGRQLRKPRPGMIQKARVELNLDLENSILVGDRASDLIAGILAGVGHIYLFASEQSREVLIEVQHWLGQILKLGILDKNATSKIHTVADLAEIKIGQSNH